LSKSFLIFSMSLLLFIVITHNQEKTYIRFT
jgi:hypothetical protein